MSKRAVAATKSSVHLDRLLADLIANTLRRKRTVSLVEISSQLRAAADLLGGVPQVATRIGISPKMLRQFQSVERLDPSVRERFQSRELDSVDAAVHLAMLPSSDQRILADALARSESDTKDLRAVLELRKHAPAAPVEQLLRKVQRSKTTREYVAEFVIRGRLEPREVKAAFTQYIPAQHLLRIEISGALGRLVFNSGRPPGTASRRAPPQRFLGPSYPNDLA